MVTNRSTVLESYTRQAINAKMKSLGYTDDNYFGNVITKNAYPFSDPKQPFLGYSWSKDSGAGESFSATFRETSWHLDLHIYGGASGGTGASVFGLGEELQWKVMAGVDYSHDSITDLDKKSGWSVGLGDTWVRLIVRICRSQCRLMISGFTCCRSQWIHRY